MIIFRLRKKGFTLIELLVVIAIIALLLAILVPSLRKVKDQAKKVVCRSNLSQWGKIWGLFLADNEDRFMNGWGGSNGGRATQWMYVIPRYMDLYNHEIWCCPFADNESKCVFNKDGSAAAFVPAGSSPYDSMTSKSPWGHIVSLQHGGYDDAAGDYGSYGINAWVYNADNPSDQYWKTATVRGASSIPVFSDSMWCEMWPGYNDSPPVREGMWSGWGSMGSACIDRHNDGTTNILFMDFSVQRVGLKKLWNLKWHRKWQSNTITNWPDWMSSY